MDSRSLRFGRRHSSATADNLTAGCKIDLMRFSTSQRYTGTSTSSWGNFDQPTSIFGASISQTISTITFTGTATHGLGADEDIEFTSVANTTKAANNQHLTDSGIGLTLTNYPLSDATNKHKATLTGTIGGGGSQTHSGMPLKVQVRKTLGDAAYANASRVVTFSGSTTTVGLTPAMPVSGTGIPAATTITSVDTSTTITLSADPTGGTLTGQSLVFEDPARVSHVNGSEILATGDSMLSIATGSGGDPVVFNGRRYMGNSVGLRQITGFGFQPDMVWFKNRPMTNSHELFDSVRGTTSRLYANLSNATDTSVTNGVTAFLSDGVQIGSSGTGHSVVGNGINQDTKHIICWGWKAGGTPSGNGKRKTDGSATETTLSASGSPGSDSTLYGTGFQYVKQSVNTAGQFSITQYQAPAITSGSAITIPHGLTGAPKFIMIKSTSNANNWHVWHNNLATPATGYLHLDLDGAEVNSTSPFGNTVPSATHVTLGISGNVNYSSREYVMYAWKDVAGVSAFGSYTGTAGAHTVTTGFQPKWILVKQINVTRSWFMVDTFRGGTGRLTKYLYANLDNAEGDENSFGITPVSTGFSFTSASTGTLMNGSGGTYIYAAFA